MQINILDDFQHSTKKRKLLKTLPTIEISPDIIDYIVRKIDVKQNNIGLRHIKKTFDDILMTINKKFLVESKTLDTSIFQITKTFIDQYFKIQQSEQTCIEHSVSMMYM
jgi:hypothetical protein